MILTGIAVFFFGTAVYAGPLVPTGREPTEIIISKNSLPENIAEFYPPSGALISNWIQKGTNVFFKPQFVLSAAQMPPQIQPLIAAIEKHDCKSALPLGPTPVLTEEALRVVQQKVVASSNPIIKEVIEINPEYVKPLVELSPAVIEMQVSEMPKMPVVVEESIDLERNKEQLAIPEAPTLSPFVPHIVPVIIEADKPKEIVTEVIIPPAPELPELEVSKIPMHIEEMPLIPTQELPESIAIVEVPPAPVLPPLEIPKLPLLIEEPAIPCSPEHIIEFKPEEKQTHTPLVLEEPKPVVIEENMAVQLVKIPPAPILPPLDLPKLSVIIEETSVLPGPSGEFVHVNPNFVEHPEMVVEEKPLVVPQPPELSPFTYPELPLSVAVKDEVVSSKAPSLPSEENERVEERKPIIPEANLDAVVIEEKPLIIPEAPVLPHFSLPQLPIKVEVEEKVVPCDTVEVLEPVMVPETPLFNPYVSVEVPSPVYVEKNEHNEDADKIGKLIEIPSASVLPPLSIEKNVVSIDAVEVIQPAVISEAPVLASFEMPTPVLAEKVGTVEKEKPTVISSAPLQPLNFEQKIVGFDTIEVMKPVAIPEAPVLAPFVPIEMPTPVIVEKETEEKVEPCVEELESIVIPEAPVLTPFVQADMPAPIFFEKLDNVEIQSPVIPSAPVLPPIDISKAPIIVEETEKKVVPCPPEQISEHSAAVFDSRPIVIPVPYALAQFSLPATYASNPIVLPSMPEFLVPYLPVVNEKFIKENTTSCVHDIVVERILPRMNKSLEAQNKVAAIPVPYLSPFRYGHPFKK